MNPHTSRIIKRMEILLNDYKNGKCTLPNLVNGLEGCLNTIEERMPEEFNNKWFIYWGGLEQILALGSEQARQKEIIDDIIGLETLISEFL